MTLILAGCFLLAALAAGGVLAWRKGAAAGEPDGAGASALQAPGAVTGRIPILRGGEPAVMAERHANALQGNLKQTPLHDLLQYLALARKSGILELVSGRRTGRIVLKDGRVYKNFYRGKEGMDAMFAMMDLAEGDFEFYEETLEDAATYSGLEVVDIIMLWMDRKPKKKA